LGAPDSLEFAPGLCLIEANAAGGDLSAIIIFAAEWASGHATKHVELPSVVQGVSDWSLKKFFGRCGERSVAGEKIVKSFHGSKEAVNFLVPRKRR